MYGKESEEEKSIQEILYCIESLLLLDVILNLLLLFN